MPVIWIFWKDWVYIGLSIVFISISLIFDELPDSSSTVEILLTFSTLRNTVIGFGFLIIWLDYNLSFGFIFNRNVISRICYSEKLFENTLGSFIEFSIYYYVRPWKGVLPSISSYSKIPNAQISILLVYGNLSRAYGAKYYNDLQILILGVRLNEIPK